jgi:hypothetical protein
MAGLPLRSILPGTTFEDLHKKGSGPFLGEVPTQPLTDFMMAKLFFLTEAWVPHLLNGNCRNACLLGLSWNDVRSTQWEHFLHKTLWSVAALGAYSLGAAWLSAGEQ